MDLELLPKCPDCGHEEQDAWEVNFGPGLDGEAVVACGACGVDYHVERVVSVSYRSRPLAD